MTENPLFWPVVAPLLLAWWLICLIAVAALVKGLWVALRGPGHKPSTTIELPEHVQCRSWLATLEEPSAPGSEEKL